MWRYLRGRRQHDPYALEQKAQVLVTGDIGHHDAIDAAAQGMAIIDAGALWTGTYFYSVYGGLCERVSGGSIEVIQAEPISSQSALKQAA